MYLHVGFLQKVKIGTNLGKRWDCYYTKYNLNVLKVKNNIGGGINEIERRGVTLLENLEKMYPHFRAHFDRLHILLGEGANVNPP